MKPRPPTGRRLVNGVVSVLAAASALMGLLALGWIFLGVLSRGVGALNVDFFTSPNFICFYCGIVFSRCCCFSHWKIIWKT